MSEFRSSGAGPLDLVLDIGKTRSKLLVLDRAGEVVVSAREAAGQITITVSDTGVGLPDGASQGTISSLGFSLIGLLTEQLQATIHWPPSGAPGATFTLQLPLRAPLR